MSASKIFTLGEINLCSGVGSLENASLCVMAGAAAIKAMEDGTPLKKETDKLECACPVLRSLVISRNDSFTCDEERTKWGRRLIPRIIGSRDDSQTEARRLKVAEVGMMKIFPELYRDEIFDGHFNGLCDELESAGTLYSESDLSLWRNKIKDAFYSFYHKKYAYAYAYAYANAYANANACAYAYAYAYANACANACANAYANAKAIIWKHYDQLIDSILQVNRNDELSPKDKARLKIKMKVSNGKVGA